MTHTEERIDPGLSGVPETMLWTLHNRATESIRPDGVLKDADVERI
ncbi:MAG: class I SAM-dependent methyltransferase, partial [Myxococcota bacterium]